VRARGDSGETPPSFYNENWDAAAAAAAGGLVTLLFGVGVVSEALADLDY
jgi:hypothetical protein